jgi:antitoxin component YwqK of YwqJK toxin-antitoxin module
MRNLLLGLIPLAAVVGWFVYLWATSGVLARVEKYPGGAVRAEGYLQRVGIGVYRRHGHWVTFHENGQKASEGLYEKGEKTGQWRYWDEDGRETSVP